MKQAIITANSARAFSAGSESGNSAAMGRTRPITDCMPLSDDQYGQVQRQQDEDATDNGVNGEFACVSHFSASRDRVTVTKSDLPVMRPR